jgi:hypothetical protein
MESTSPHGRQGFRVSRKSDQTDDVIESFEWQPSKDSDELFEALKLAFPRGKTHRSRMREALIELLVQECEAEQDTRKIPQPIEPHLSTESTTTKHNSPQDDFAKAILIVPPSSQSLGPGLGAVTKVPQRKKLPKDWDDMTVVWTTRDGVIRRSGLKRTMTEQERAEYQLRRAQGACSVCKKKKRKVRLTSILLNNSQFRGQLMWA